jgi:hypothetical protein
MSSDLVFQLVCTPLIQACSLVGIFKSMSVVFVGDTIQYEVDEARQPGLSRTRVKEKGGTFYVSK